MVQRIDLQSILKALTFSGEKFNLQLLFEGPGKGNKPGSVGRPYTAVDVKLLDCQEIGVRSTQV